MGRMIPKEAIRHFSLNRWFRFKEVDDYSHLYTATPKNRS